MAEKPSVATDYRGLERYSVLLRKKARPRMLIRIENATITSAVGHLVELRIPTGTNGKKLLGISLFCLQYDDFELQAIEKTEGGSNMYSLFVARSDCIVNACDAGQEGELIFKYIMKISKIEKPICVCGCNR